MAMITTSSGRTFPAIDPEAEPSVKPLTGRGLLERGLPDVGDPTNLTYDDLSDTFVLRFGDPSRPAVLTDCIDEICVLLHPETEELVGIQAEHFLTIVVPAHPELADVLNVADLRGITREDAQRARRRALGFRRRLQLWAASLTRSLRRGSSALPGSSDEKARALDSIRSFTHAIGT